MSYEATSAGLQLCMGHEVEPELLASARPWLLAVVDEVHRLPPLGFIVDLGRLLLGHGLATEVARTPHVALNAALDAYAEHVIGRLRNDPRLLAAMDAVARIAPEHLAGAIAALTQSIIHRIGADLPSCAAGPVRRLLRRPNDEIIELGRDSLATATIAEGLTEQLTTLVAAARREGMLLHEGDVFLLENVESLRNASQRLAFAHIADAATALERPLPKRMRSKRSNAGRAPTRLEAESTYPTGGYSSIATYGSIENLVSSELAYLEDGKAIDLFDVRYATNELLKFTRDESVFLRESRTIVVSLSADLVRCRVKDAHQTWQRLVIVCGVVVAAVRRLVQWLDEQDLRIELLFDDELRAERDLVAMFLREYVESGVVVFMTGTTLQQEQLRLDDERDSRQVDIIAIAECPPALDFEALRVRAAATPEVLDGIVTPSTRTGLTVWSEVLLALLRELV